MPASAGDRHRHPWRAAKDFYWKAYEDNITGLSGMVAYNLLLSVFPLALLALFIAGRVLESPDVERSILEDLQQLFPTAADDTLTNALDRIRDTSTGFGVVALLASIWIGASFWGALDTAFARIYHVAGRTWLRQKRFSLVMLVVVILFMAATVAVPTLQSVLVAGAGDLPLGLSEVDGLFFALSLAARPVPAVRRALPDLLGRTEGGCRGARSGPGRWARRWPSASSTTPSPPISPRSARSPVSGPRSCSSSSS